MPPECKWRYLSVAWMTVWKLRFQWLYDSEYWLLGGGGGSPAFTPCVGSLMHLVGHDAGQGGHHACYNQDLL